MNNIASPWKRLLAYLNDQILFAIFPLLLIFIFSSSPDVISVLNRFSSYLIFLIFAYPVVYAVFISFLVSAFGGTFGKLLTGTKIVRADGTKLSFKRAFFRNYIGYMVSGLLLGLGFWWILIDKERRVWHDQIADTYVVVRNKWLVVLGAILLVVFIFAGYMLISASILNFKSNQGVYLTIVSEITTDLKPNSPTTAGQPTPIPFDLNQP